MTVYCSSTVFPEVLPELAKLYRKWVSLPFYPAVNIPVLPAYKND